MLQGSVTRLPALAGPAFRPFGAGPISAALGDVRDAVTSRLRGNTSGGIAAGWSGTVTGLGTTVALGVTNAHPGARPLDQGATWPGPMPPWGPPGSGRLSFPAARTLKARGLAPRHFVARTVDELHGTILETLMDHGVRRWVLPGG